MVMCTDPTDITTTDAVRNLKYSCTLSFSRACLDVRCGQSKRGHLDRSLDAAGGANCASRCC